MTATRTRRPLPAAYPLPDPKPPTDALAPARRADDTRLTKAEEIQVARAAELDLRDLTDDELDVANLQRVLEHSARQSSDQMWKRAAASSDAAARRMLAEVRRLRRVRATEVELEARILAKPADAEYLDVPVDARTDDEATEAIAKRLELDEYAAGPDAPSPEEHAADLRSADAMLADLGTEAGVLGVLDELVGAARRQTRRSRKPVPPEPSPAARVAAAAKAADAKPKRPARAATKPATGRKARKAAPARAATKAAPAAARRVRNKLWRCPVCKTRTRLESCPRDATPAPAGKRLAETVR